MSSLEEIQQIVSYDGPDRIMHWKEYLLLKIQSNNKRVLRFQSDFDEFDKATGGLETGEVVVITGYTKNGKTLFAESWLRSMAYKDPRAKAAIFSFEVQTEKLLIKYMKDEIESLVYVPGELKAMDFEWLLARCKEAKFKHNCRIVLIDHLHFLVDMATKQNMSLNIGGFMRRLKHEIAIGLDLAVVLIAHQGQPKEGQSASLGNIRDSSFVGQESDATIIVARREDLDGKELEEVGKKRGMGVLSRFIRPEGTPKESKFSTNLALVKVACHRRTGAFDWAKMFQKRGEFLEEV